LYVADYGTGVILKVNRELRIHIWVTTTSKLTE
jgi:hypothetical protein